MKIQADTEFDRIRVCVSVFVIVLHSFPSVYMCSGRVYFVYMSWEAAGMEAFRVFLGTTW